MKKASILLILVVIVLLVLISFYLKEEVIVQYIEEINTGSGGDTNPKFAIQSPAGTDILNVTHGGEVEIKHNLTVGGIVNAKLNFTTGDDYNSFDGYVLDFNESKLAITFYNVITIEVVTGTPQGALTDIQTYNNIPFNVSEVVSDLELRVNFSVGVGGEFNNLIVRYKSTEEDEPHIMAVQIYKNETEIWEDYGTLVGNSVYQIVQFGVFDSDDHVDANGIVQIRFYQDEGTPSKTHKHEFDWVTISKGFGTPAGEEIDPVWNSEKSDYYTKAEVYSVGSLYNQSWINSIGNFTAWDMDYGDLINTPTDLGDFTNNAGFISELSNDTSPQLGGTLDANGNDIEIDSGNKYCLNGNTCDEYVFRNTTGLYIIYGDEERIKMNSTNTILLFDGEERLNINSSHTVIS